jgi:hypothetical protein
MADIKELLSNNPLFANANRNALLSKDDPKEEQSHLEGFDTVSGIQTLFEAKAETWGVTSQEVCRGAEYVLNEISSKLDRPYRRGNMTTGNIWNIAMLVLGEVVRTLPDGWESHLKGLSEKELYQELIKLLINHLRSIS